jgi:L-ribulose-5-phosphate 4-epimerase
MTDRYDLKKMVYDATMALNQAGLIRLSAGNISMRGENGLVAITPSDMSYDTMRVEDIVMVDLDGRFVAGDNRPSSEMPMHTAIYRCMPEVNAVVHTHSIFSMTFASVGLPIEPICIEGLAPRGTVPVARYAPPGSEAAGVVAVEALQATPGLRAILLQNHGLVTVGPDIVTAWQTAYKVEILAQVNYQARQLGKPIVLTDEQIAEIYQIYSVAK